MFTISPRLRASETLSRKLFFSGLLLWVIKSQPPPNSFCDEPYFESRRLEITGTRQNTSFSFSTTLRTFSTPIFLTALTNVSVAFGSAITVPSGNLTISFVALPRVIIVEDWPLSECSTSGSSSIILASGIIEATMPTIVPIIDSTVPNLSTNDFPYILISLILN